LDEENEKKLEEVRRLMKGYVQSPPEKRKENVKLAMQKPITPTKQ
jgi:hypothetical protein